MKTKTRPCALQNSSRFQHRKENENLHLCNVTVCILNESELNPTGHHRPSLLRVLFLQKFNKLLLRGGCCDRELQPWWRLHQLQAETPSLRWRLQHTSPFN
ncbi:hypothetical protein VIGAN_11134400 [Vigna angularis var. angularis]|uniref:Uncharacterized protein n=1 Tax=Vigna angularis var. angularis TaxID=157739 RepID=A0A0S3TAA7_PHAAN|nr:hypothetical protein VIGAN_11134400 [Vigna angularis var. angularis]